MKKKISMFLLCSVILLGVCGCKNDDIKQDSKIKTKENIEIKEDADNKQDENDSEANSTAEDVNEKEEVKKEETKPSTSNNSSTTNDNKQENTTQSTTTPANNAESNNTDSNNDVSENTENDDYKTNIIGVWSIDNKPHTIIFTENKVTEIFTSYNYMEEYNYTIDEDYVILNETRAFKYDLKDNVLYMGNSVYKKRDESYIPSIYYNIDVFNGTWKLNSDINKIVLENGSERTLDEEIIITKQNTSGFGSCGGSGCRSYLINFNNNKPELYDGSLCYELVDKNTLVQIKCQQGSEDQAIHNITYKKIN